MTYSNDILVQVPEEVSDLELERKLNARWKELISNLSSLPVPGAPALTAAQREHLAGENIPVNVQGAGVDPATIAILISLTPLIKAIVPLVQPFATNAADLAHTVALDLWNHLKDRLWHEDHISLQEKS
jgi:hypothetical protein